MKPWAEKFGMLLSRLSNPRFLRKKHWPPYPGKYFVITPTAPAAVSTLGSPDLASRLYERKPANLCIAGKTETENVGIEKVVLNTLANPYLRYLVLAGADPPVHLSGRSLIALAQHGMDSRGNIRRAPGRHPVLRNITSAQVEAFRNRIQVIDMIGSTAVEEISSYMEDLPQQPISGSPPLADPIPVPRIQAGKPRQPKMDPAGYFVILPDRELNVIVVEHYGYDHRLLHTIEGTDPRSLYRTIIDQGWVTELSHAAYLGRELTRARQALDQHREYDQDQA